MFLQIGIALVLTWLALLALFHLAVFGMAWVSRERGKTIAEVRDTPAFQALTWALALLMVPVFIPVAFIRWMRWLAFVLRMASYLASKTPRTDIDLTLLPEDEQRAFLERLHGTEGADRLVVLREMARRVREVQREA